MNKITTERSKDDVSRLLKQLHMDSFEFRTFDRTQSAGESELDADGPAPQALVPPVPLVKPAAPSATGIASAPPRTAHAAVDQQEGLVEAFSRLVRKTPIRPERNLSLRLNLPVRRSSEALDTQSGELSIDEVFGRLQALAPLPAKTPPPKR